MLKPQTRRALFMIVFVFAAIVASAVFIKDFSLHGFHLTGLVDILFLLFVLVLVMMLIGIFFGDYSKNYDLLTDLPNRKHFFLKLHKLYKKSQIKKNTLFLIYMDIDQFKNINDNYGHAVGDDLIRLIARRLRSVVPKKDYVARIGGDAFAIIATNINRIDYLVKSICQAVNKPYRLQGIETHITTSIGVANSHDLAFSHDLIKYAEVALYAAKKQGPGQTKYFSRALINKRLRTIYIQNSLRTALTHDQFYLLYQPIVNAETKTIVGVEALVRWYHPEFGEISPDEFIPIAESCGYISAIGFWVIQNACQQFNKWNHEQTLATDFKLSINLSPQQILSQQFIIDLNKILATHSICAANLQFEITETALANDLIETKQLLQELADSGFNIVIDDFGTGFCSLNYLKELPVNALKISRNFVKDLPEDEKDRAIINAAVVLANSLNLKLIIEGVETKEQLDYIQSVGCKYVQGYYFAEPSSDPLASTSKKV